MKKILNYIKSPKKIIIYLMNKNFFCFLKDKTYLKMKFKLIMGYKLDLNNPRTFNEKLQWLKLYNRNSLYTMMVDKCEVRNYIKEKLGAEYLIPVIGIYDSFSDIDFSKLPDKFVIKPNHTSGDVYICKDKSKINLNKLEKLINKWLKRNYYKVHREWPYKNVAPKIIIEKYMEDSKNKELIDYKIMCFNGIPKMSFTCTERFKGDLKVTFFNLDWNKLPFKRHYEPSNQKILKPINYDKMLEFAKVLSKDIPFVRVDFYEINGKLYFGELTFYPGSGYEEFSPFEWDLKIGDMLKLPNNKL